MTPNSRLLLNTGRWYGWTMYPGYAGRTYKSPILIRNIAPLESGKQLLRIGFFNAFYAAGVREFDKLLHVLKRSERFIAFEELDGNTRQTDRLAVIEELTKDWLRDGWPQISFAEMSNQDLQAEVGKKVKEALGREY